MEVLGERPRKKRLCHLSQQTKSLLEQRSAVKRRDPTSDVNRSEYSRLNKLVKKSCKNDDNNWAHRIADDLEQAAGRGQQREIWQKIKVLSNNKKRKQSTAVRDKSGKLIADPEAQKHRWKEHFSELLNPPNDATDLSDLDGVEPKLSFDNMSDDDGPPTHAEISAALWRLKNHKTPGVDEITNEQLKYGEKGLIAQLHDLFAKVWQQEKIPQDWLKGAIVILGKKGDTSICSNNRGITLRSTVSKLLQMILLRRMHHGMERLLRENQCGFRSGRSCIDQIHSLRTLIHNSIDYNIPLYINFVDFKAAFDSINRSFIWRCLRHYGLPEKYVRIFQAFFNGTVSAVKVNGELTEWFDVKSGTGQGDIQGPPIFNFCINLAAELAEQNKVIGRGAVLQEATPSHPGKDVMDTDYADDMALLDNTKEGLQETTDLLCKYTAYAGLKVNVKKTQVMAIGKGTSQRPYTEKQTLNTVIEGQEIEQVSNFTYLGVKLSSDGTIDKEISTRIQKATGAFNQLNNIWINRNIRTPTKIRIYKAAVLTILLYGGEVWNTTQGHMKRLSVFHLRCLRRILRIRWYHRVSNEKVLEQAGITDIDVSVSAMRLRWYGHVVRMPEERLPNYLLNWTPSHGKRSRGRPRKPWTSCVREDGVLFTGNKDLSLVDMAEMANSRKKWREMILKKKERNCGAGHSND